MSQSMDLTSMQWRPRLIRLTSIPIKNVDDDAPTPLYIDPGMILLIMRIFGGYGDNKDDAASQKRACTAVYVTGYSGPFLVSELPDEIAAKRDGAFGFKAPGPTTIKSV